MTREATDLSHSITRKKERKWSQLRKQEIQMARQINIGNEKEYEGDKMLTALLEEP